ncbi:MAG: hypothetical protein IKK58_03905 [Clostridia bacterium]|nr:hypothetical protein [Clostridia bacterium]
MKKYLMILFVAVMSVMLVVPAFAAEGATGDKITTPSGAEINLTNWDSFAAVPVGDTGFFWIDPGCAGAVAEIKASSNDANAKSVYYTTDPTCMYINVALNPTHGAGYADFVNNRGDSGIGANTKAIVMRVKTNREILFGLNGNIWDGGSAKGCQLAATGDPIWLVDAETSLVKNAKIHTDKFRNTVVIPGGFDGFLVLPTSRIATEMTWTNNEPDGPATVGNWNSGALAGFVHFWQWFTYFQQTGDSAATIEIMDMYVVNETLPTLADEDYATADVSVIAYAVAAITGLGALVVAKKR